MRIGEVARTLGITVQAIRFYEREGLIPQPLRSDGGYRIYSASDAERVAFIQSAKTMGFSLAEIRRILNLRDNNTAPCNEVITIANEHLHQVNVEIDRLKHYRSKLTRALAAWNTGAECASGSKFCSLIEDAVSKKSRA